MLIFHKTPKKLLSVMFLILLGIVNTAFVFSQSKNTEKNTTSRIGLGYSFNGYREETIIGANRYLNTFLLSVNGEVEKGKFLQAYNIGFFRGTNKAELAYPLYDYELRPEGYGQLFDSYKSKDNFTRFYMEYALDYGLWGNETFPGSLGGALRTDLYVIDTLINPIYISFTGIVSFNLHLTQKLIINPANMFLLSFSMPLFGYAVRPHYIGFSAWPLEYGFTSILNYWAGFINVKYQYKINSLLSLYSDAGIELSRIDFPKPRMDAGMKLNIGAAFTY